MAELKVEVTKVRSVIKHPNADRLDIAKVWEYDVVVGRDQYKAGDLAVYFPIGSILPKPLMDFVFSSSAKVQPTARIRATRIRGTVSQGLLVSLDTVLRYVQRQQTGADVLNFGSLGSDLTAVLGVEKHDPDKGSGSPYTVRHGHQQKRKECHSTFPKYTNINHFEREVKSCFSIGEHVLVTEKIHGTNFRAGWVPTKHRGIFDRLRQTIFRGLLPKRFRLPEFTFVFGSHNVELKPASDGAAFKNVYHQAVDRFGLQEFIPKGIILYGEIYGSWIQRGYGYGLPHNDFGLRVFDMFSVDRKRYLDFRTVRNYAKTLATRWPKNVGLVPYTSHVYNGLPDLETRLNRWCGMKSLLDGITDVEGFVIRSVTEDYFNNGLNRKILKLLSKEFLLKKNMTDYH